jgi:Tol biopolymer transport system component
MTERRDLDRELTAYLEGRSTNRAPAGLLEATLTRVDATRQRPAWLLVGRRLADRMPRPALPPVSSRVVLALILLIALVIASVIVAGSQRRLPPPFGLAKSGAIAVDVGGHIAVMKADGTGLTMLTSGPERDSYPVWSPDGTRFAFASYHYGSFAEDNTSTLEVMDADGGHRTTLVKRLSGVVQGALAEQIAASWSPDSRRVAFSGRLGDDVEARIYVADADRSGATELGGSEMYGFSPSWSPDGSTIAFKRIHPCCGGPPDSLWIMRSDGSGARQLSAVTATGGDFARAAWSPDGGHLAFLAPGNSLNYDIFVVNADGTGQTNITESIEDELWPSWSPDGTRIAFTRAALGSSSLDTGVFVVNADGSNTTRIGSSSVPVTTVLWSPDGTRVLGFQDDLGGGPGDSLTILDPARRVPPTTIPLSGAGAASWQRVAP